MANYSKLTDFASKDTLPTGNAAKIVKGTEIDDEFEAIETSIATKANTDSPSFTGTPTAPTAGSTTNTTQVATTAFVQAQKTSPAFTGTPTAPTATQGTDTTQIATTAFVRTEADSLQANIDALEADVDATKAPLASPALTGAPTAPTQAYGNDSTRIATTEFVQAALAAVYPVGSVYINAASTTNPATLLGFGTWVEIGAGKVLVGQDTGDSSFNSMGETGGSKDAIVPSHSHTASSGAGGAHSHSYRASSSGSYDYTWPVSNTDYGGGFGGDKGSKGTQSGYIYDSSTHTHSVTVNSTGTSATNANLQPYMVVKMWKRTA